MRVVSAPDEPLGVFACLEEARPVEFVPAGEAGPMEDVEASGWAFEGSQSRGIPRRRETALGLGVAIGLHAVVPLLIVLLGFFFAVPSASEPTIVTVSLADLPGSGTGAGGSPGAPGATGGGGLKAKIASPKPITVPAAIPKKVEPKPPNVIALPAKPLMHIPVRKRAVIRRQKEKVVRVPAPSLKHFSKPVHHRIAATGEPPDAPAAAPSADSLAEGVSASGAGAGVSSSSAGGGSLSGSGGGAGGGPGLGTGSGGNGFGKVDKPPVPIKRVEPEYPDEARQLGISGRVVLKFLVESDGRVSRASVLSARPVGVFNRSALAAIVEWRFKPGLYRGKPVAAWVELPVSFHLSR
ncbi:MAG: energy transducer TonB [Syntrophobacteraceae bacterium]